MKLSATVNVISVKRCLSRFDDLSDTIFAKHHQPLQTWILCLYLMGLNLSTHQIAQELDLNKDDAQLLDNTTALRHCGEEAQCHLIG